ncbi:ester cyclase, partial [Salmonella enterica]|uniref:ester cyclase n=1 Tax=Salmonella enterica TaxID=28901 RepID=UPI003EDC9326
AERYRLYIDCLNERRWGDLSEFTEEILLYNGEPLTAAEYRDARIDDFDRIPDLRFVIGLLVVQGEHVGARLDFRCTPA